jgi:outer membrane protein assembly factor BamB
VVVYFGSYGLICFDMQGQELWELRMPLAKSFAGNATSPAIVGDRVILYRGTYVDHFLLAVDKHSGKQLWKVPQDEPFTGEMACTACPIVAGDTLIVHTARSIQAFDLSTGQQVWVAKCNTTATSTPVLAGDEVIVAAWNKMGEPSLRPPFPSFEELIEAHDRNDDKRVSREEFPTLWIFHRPDGAEAPMNGGTVQFRYADKNKDGGITAGEWSVTIRDLEGFRAGYDTHGMLAIRVDSQGLLGADEIRTLETQGIPEVPSPICADGRVYFVKNGGILTCVDLGTGQRVYRTRTRGRGTHYASPLVADGKIFSFAGDGHVSVLALGADPEILAVNDMQEGVYATPAIVEGTIYVRTLSTLYAFRSH